MAMRNTNLTKVIAAENLPDLPNWLPFCTNNPRQAERNMAALLAVARRVLGERYAGWLNAMDNAYADKLRRIEAANMWLDLKPARRPKRRAA